MSFLDRVADCHRWTPETYRPFVVNGLAVGRVTDAFAARLAGHPAVFEVDAGAVTLASGLKTFEDRSAAVAEVLARLRGEGAFPVWRDEFYPVLHRWNDEPLLRIERGAVPDFGVRGFGVHLNGYVRDPRSGALGLWVGKRSMTKPTGPGKLDHLAAGGQPHGIGIVENMIKECAEEADIPRALAERVVPVGLVSYRCERPEGLRDDDLFCFDLELPADFTPKNTDGEVEAFSLWPIEKVAERIRETEDFKFNCALVIIDFFIRHGLIAPDDPDYTRLAEGLRRRD